MSDSSSSRPYMIAIAAGAALWAVGSAVSGRREAWDSGMYWAIFYPAAIAVCAILGYWYPERPWRWCLALFAAQFMTMGLMAGEVGNLAPLGLILFGVLSVPAIWAAKLTAGRKRPQ